MSNLDKRVTSLFIELIDNVTNRGEKALSNKNFQKTLLWKNPRKDYTKVSENQCLPQRAQGQTCCSNLSRSSPFRLYDSNTAFCDENGELTMLQWFYFYFVNKLIKLLWYKFENLLFLHVGLKCISDRIFQWDT